MDYSNDFLGSFADENVVFNTEILKNVSVGDNYWKVMVFADASQTLVNEASPDAPKGWARVPGKNALCASMTSDDYTEYVTETLQQWLSDLFEPGFTGDVYVVVPSGISTDEDDVVTGWTPLDWASADDQLGISSEDPGYGTITLTDVYNYMKPYAYHKTMCAYNGDSLAVDTIDAFAGLCKQDYQLLSGCPLLPYINYSDATTEANQDELYAAISSSGNDAFFSACMDETRNGSLASLGIALSETNGSGTCVGNGIDMTSTSGFVCSGEDGMGLDKAARDFLAGINVQTWKWVGNNSGDVAAYGEKTVNGDLYVADWIIAYIAYMVKVGVAELLTSKNFLKNETNYSKILSVMNVYLGKFGPSGSGRLESLQTTAPAFNQLPDTDGETLTIPNAWTAKYVGRLSKVEITGTLYLGD